MHRLMIVAVVLLSAVLGTNGVMPSRAAAADAHTYLSVDAGNGLNLREGPSGSYARILTMVNGSTVKRFGARGRWTKVRYLATGDIGWAFSAYLVAASAPATGGGGDPPSGLRLCYDTSFNWTACAPEWIAGIIYAAARAYGIGPFWLMSLAACESGFDPNSWAVSPPDNVYGLFQFRPSTMAWIYPGGNVWSVSDSSYAAAKLLTVAPAQFDCAWRIGFS